MEKSVKRELSGAKLLPLSLVVIGLVCASWLSVGVENKPTDFKNKESGIATDTTAVPDNDSSLPVARRDADASDATLYKRPFIPGFDRAPADMSFQHIPPAYMFESDSIPGFLYAPNADWTEFEREFTSKFREEFGDFFEKNKGQIEKMMKELREQHGDNGFMYSYGFNNLSEDDRRAVEAQMALIDPQLENLQDFALPKISADVWQMKEQAELLSKQALADHDWSVQQQDLALHYEQLARAQEEFMVNNQLFMLDQEEKLRVYEKEMIDQLTEDGYLDKGEKAKDLHIQNGEVTINGKKVKKADEAKYKAIIDRFNSHPRIPKRPE